MHDMYVQLKAAIYDVDCAKYVGAYDLLFVVFAPIGVRLSMIACSVDYARRLHTLKLTTDKLVQTVLRLV